MDHKKTHIIGTRRTTATLAVQVHHYFGEAMTQSVNCSRPGAGVFSFIFLVLHLSSPPAEDHRSCRRSTSFITKNVCFHDLVHNPRSSRESGSRCFAVPCGRSFWKAFWPKTSRVCVMLPGMVMFCCGRRVKVMQKRCTSKYSKKYEQVEISGRAGRFHEV